jgi:hypothetical protein
MAHSMWDLDQKAADLAHDMLDDVIEELWGQGILKARGPHAPKSVSLRVSNWSTLHKWEGIEGQYDEPSVKKAVLLAMKVSGHAPSPGAAIPSLAVFSTVSWQPPADRVLLACAYGNAPDGICRWWTAAQGGRKSKTLPDQSGRSDQAPASRSAFPTMPCIRITPVRTEQPRRGRVPWSLAAGQVVALHK